MSYRNGSSRFVLAAAVVRGNCPRDLLLVMNLVSIWVNRPLGHLFSCLWRMIHVVTRVLSVFFFTSDMAIMIISFGQKPCHGIFQELELQDLGVVAAHGMHLAMTLVKGHGQQ